MVATTAVEVEKRAGRPRGGGRSPDENRAHILAAAESLFRREDATTTTMAQIADEAGVSRALVYRHFSSRDAIVRGVLQSAALHVMASMSDLAASAETLGELVSRATAELVPFARSNPLIADLFRDTDRYLASRMVVDDVVIHEQVRDFTTALLDSRPDLHAEVRDDVPFDLLLDHLVLTSVSLVNAPPSIAGTADQLVHYAETFLVPVLVRQRR